MIQIIEQRIHSRKLLTRPEDFPVEVEVDHSVLTAFVGNVSLSGLLLFIKGFEHIYKSNVFDKGDLITGQGFFKGLGTHFIFKGRVVWSGPLIRGNENRYAVGVALDDDQVFPTSLMGFVMAQSEEWN